MLWFSDQMSANTAKFAVYRTKSGLLATRNGWTAECEELTTAAHDNLAATYDRKKSNLKHLDFTHHRRLSALQGDLLGIFKVLVFAIHRHFDCWDLGRTLQSGQFLVKINDD